MADSKAAPSVMAASITWPRPERCASYSALSSPKASSMAPPLNLVGDFGGGAMLLAFGVLSALYEAQRSGRGQVIDAAMTDGAALLSAMMYGLKAAGR